MVGGVLSRVTSHLGWLVLLQCDLRPLDTPLGPIPPRPPAHNSRNLAVAIQNDTSSGHSLVEVFALLWPSPPPKKKKVLMNDGWNRLWRGHPVQPTDHLMPSPKRCHSRPRTSPPPAFPQVLSELSCRAMLRNQTHGHAILVNATGSLEPGGGGIWDPEICVLKMARKDFPYCRFRFCPTMATLVWRGGSRGGYPPSSYGVRPFEYFPGRGPSPVLLLPCSSPPPPLQGPPGIQTCQQGSRRRCRHLQPGVAAETATELTPLRTAPWNATPLTTSLPPLHRTALEPRIAPLPQVSIGGAILPRRVGTHH